MQTALRATTTVLAGGRIELVDPQLPAGEAVDVIVLFPEIPATKGHSVLDVLRDAPGQLGFGSAEDVDTYLRSERDAWDS